MRKSLFVMTIAMTQLMSLQAQSRGERREQAIRESEKPRNLTGGNKFTVKLGYGKAYDSVLNSLKKADYTFESSSQEAGQIITTLAVEGGWRQKGRRLIVTFIREKDGVTTIKCVVTLQTRYKALQTEPWSEPAIDEEETSKVARSLEDTLKAL